MKKPLVLIGGLDPRHRERVRELVRGAAVLAEPLSGLREHSTITAGERMIARGRFDGVIRIGNVPTLRFWRDLETLELPVEHFSDLPFTGLTRGHVQPLDALQSISSGPDDEFFALDREMRARIERIVDDEPESELAMLRALSRELSEDARVYLGNSLPIREWDLVAARKPFEHEANRGANGIDGQLSTFFGWCKPGRENVCIVGDLTALYDLNAPWIVSQLDSGTRFRIVVVNNGGGRIFSRVASLRSMDAGVRERIVENAHALRFDHWAAMWNIDMTELTPDADASRRVWQRYDDLWGQT
jgi:2-succinyl-5-enolpyruvyl-6-hydroxy-3-cyclohexene-1-carboxylate synthase